MTSLADTLGPIAARLGDPEGDPIPLEGGITSRNFLVRFAGEDVVVRLPGKDAELLGIDRLAERAAGELAARAGVGPAVVVMLDDPPCLVTEFVVGEPMTAEELREPAAVTNVATALRIEAVLVGPEHEPVPCHNDLLSANFIRTRRGVRIVDWEYAGMGDRYFDLGNFAVNNELDSEGEAALLSAYFPAAASERRLAALQLMRFMSDFREAMWGAVQSTISDLDFDFSDYCEKHFERMREFAAGGRLELLLEAAASSP